METMVEPPELPEGIEYKIQRVLFHDPGTYWAECYVWVIDHKVYCRKTGRGAISTDGWENDKITADKRFRPKKKIVR